MPHLVRTRNFIRHPARTRRAALIGVFLGMLCISGNASAEPDPVGDRQSVEMLAAHAVARAALVDLKIVGNPTPRDFRIAEELLATASSLLPNDQTILRLYLEAAAGANDGPAIREITRQLVKLDPADTVSQLRMISARISDLQTVEERLAAYDRFVGDGGQAFDDSVRSRLALDAALLYRERGDLTAFQDRLAQAIELDPTNKDAATLALTFYQPKAQDGPAGRLDLMFQVLWGDPFDSSIYSSIVSELLANGAYRGAFRFAKLQRRLAGIQNLPVPDADDRAYDLAEWNASGPEAVLRRLDDGFEKLRQRAAEQRKQAIDQGVVADGLPRVEQVHLPAARERSRVLCALAIGDAERATGYLGQLAQIVAEMSREAEDPLKRPKGVSVEDARRMVLDARLELTWLRLLGGIQVEEARTELAELRVAGEKAGGGEGGLDPAVLAKLDAWVVLRTGSKEEAERMFAPLAESDDFAALGMAVCAEARGDNEAAAARFQETYLRDPGNFIGALAAARFKAITGERPQRDDAAGILETDAAGVPEILDAMVDNPRRVMALEVTPLRPDISPTDRTPVRVTLRNTSGMMLAMGPDKPICTRLLFAPVVDIGPDQLPTSDLVWVANLDRRLRLNKNESVDMIVWPDIGPLSLVMEVSVPRQARILWRVLQGFEFSEQRFFDAAPQMLTADLPPMMRRPPNRTDAVFEAIRLAFQTGGPRELADAVLSFKLQNSIHAKDFAALRAKVMQDQQNGVALKQADQDAIIAEQTRLQSERDRLMEILAGRISSGSMTPAAKILMLCLTPNIANLPEALRVDQVAIRDADEHVLAVELATRIASPDDPFLSAPNVIRSPRLTALAQLVKERLEKKVPTLATASFGARDFVGPGYVKVVTPPRASSTKSSGDSEPRVRYVRPITPTVPPDPSPVPSVP